MFYERKRKEKQRKTKKNKEKQRNLRKLLIMAKLKKIKKKKKKRKKEKKKKEEIASSFRDLIHLPNKVANNVPRSEQSYHTVVPSTYSIAKRCAWFHDCTNAKTCDRGRRLTTPYVRTSRSTMVSSLMTKRLVTGRSVSKIKNRRTH